MADQHVALGPNVIRALLDARRRVAETKYLYLKIVQAPSIMERVKSQYKEQVVELSLFVHRFFDGLHFERANKYNIDDYERMIAEFLRDLAGKTERMRSRAREIMPLRLDLDVAATAEDETDAALAEARLLGQPAVESDKLDRLGEVRRFLLRVARAPEPPPGEEQVRQANVRRELMQLKVRNHMQSFSGNRCSNLDILYKVVTRLSGSLANQVPVNVVEEGRGPDADANYGELYVTDPGDGNMAVYFREVGLAVFLQILVTYHGEGEVSRYRGEISGWAEAGVDRVEFLLRDREAVPGGDLEDPRVAGAVESFLSKAELLGSYRALREACAAKAVEMERLQERVEREAKEKVSRALDTLL